MTHIDCCGRCALSELAAVFLRLGSTAFGGPAAHIALMEEEFVRRRAWLSHEEFLDLLGATNLIPGPNSTEMALHIGQRRAGVPGLLIAGICFILPSAWIVAALASAYKKFGALPEVTWILYGVKPVIIAIVAQALWGLARKSMTTGIQAGIGLAVGGLNFLGVHELLLLSLAGLFSAAQAAPRSKQAAWVVSPIFSFGPGGSTGIAVASVASPFSLLGLFFFFLKIGSVLFGSGYVLLAFLRADLVERWHWLTENQLLDAIAVGQITPGPLFTAATFIGYLLGGPVSALLATIAIFLPAFVFVAVSGPFIPRLRASRTAGALLDGVNTASLALMGVVTVQLAAAALIDWPTVALAASAGIALVRYRVNSIWLILGGAVVGIVKFLR